MRNRLDQLDCEDQKRLNRILVGVVSFYAVLALLLVTGFAIKVNYVGWRTKTVQQQTEVN